MLRFPLFERAERLGVLDGGSALIVAPTATGKSRIGREAVCSAPKHGDAGTQAYLVPFRALAAPPPQMTSGSVAFACRTSLDNARVGYIL